MEWRPVAPPRDWARPDARRLTPDRRGKGGEDDGRSVQVRQVRQDVTEVRVVLWSPHEEGRLGPSEINGPPGVDDPWRAAPPHVWTAMARAVDRPWRILLRPALAFSRRRSVPSARPSVAPTPENDGAPRPRASYVRVFSYAVVWPKKCCDCRRRCLRDSGATQGLGGTGRWRTSLTAR